MKIKYPKENKVIRMSNKIPKENNENARKIKELEQIVDELETKSYNSNQRQQSNADMSALANTVASNSSRISDHDTQIASLSTADTNHEYRLSTLEHTAQTQTQDISNLQTGKQDKLTAGQNVTIQNGTISANVDTSTLQPKLTAGANITIDQNNQISATNTTYTAGANVNISNGVISATNTTYSAGSNITIDANNQISATNTTYTAGEGISISDGVISATGGSGGGADLTSLTAQVTQNASDIESLRRQMGIYHGIIDPNYLDETFTQYPDGTIVTENDTYERELDISASGTADLLLPNIFFTTDNQIVTEVDGEPTTQTAYANYAVTIKFTPSGAADTTTFSVYDGSTLLGSFSSTFVDGQLGTEQTITQTISNCAISGKSHNFYIVSKNTSSNTNTNVGYLKVDITAPNVVILNKIEPFDVEFNYYTNKYYLTDCSTGFLKYCEIDANDLQNTSDIVWTTTSIEAQNCKVGFFTKQDANNNYVLGDKYYLITHKNNRVEMKTDTKTFTFAVNYKVGLPNIYFGNNYAGLIMLLQSKETYSYLSAQVSNNISLAGFTIQSGLTIPMILDNSKYYNDYYSNNYAVYAGLGVNKNNAKMCFITTSGNYFVNTSIEHTKSHKLYLKTLINSDSGQYKVCFKYFDKFVSFDINNTTSVATFSNYSVIGEYDNYFAGANNDYFCVSNKKLYYFKNSNQQENAQ